MAIEAEARVFSDNNFRYSALFEKSCFDYFNNNYMDHENINTCFIEMGVFWHRFDGLIIRPYPYQRVSRALQGIINIAEKWELINPGKRLHKGTPYYFYGVICILQGDIDQGLLSMHQAYREDILSNFTDINKPARSFISLNVDNKYQFFRQKVVEVTDFLEELLKNYCKYNSSKFSLSSLRKCFLDNSLYNNEAYYFIYCLFKIQKLIKHVNANIRKNELASYIETSSIFELCKLSEVLVRKIYKDEESRCGYNLGKKPSFTHFLECFCRDDQIKLNLTQKILTDTNNNKFNQDLDKTISSLLNNDLSIKIGSSKLQPIECSILLAYCLRNFGGHKIEDQKVIYQNFDSIMESLFYTIFFIIEKKL